MQASPIKKIKVAWFCYFSNHFVQEMLKPSKKIGEFAPWINDLIPLFENNESIELHIISQHRNITGYRSFKNKNITYHFFNYGIPFWGIQWPSFFRVDSWTGFYNMKFRFAQIVKKIKPDIIHMHGTENIFCTAITQFYNKYPVLITVQGFIHKATDINALTIKRSKKEFEILRLFNHFAYRTETMKQEIAEINPQATLHWHDGAMKKIQPKNLEKIYDLVFFARVCKDKGIEDLLNAMFILKKSLPNISLCVIGGGDISIWQQKADELKVNENIVWAGFLKTQEDVFTMASEAKICVLPTHHDIIPGTIIESMFLKLPVVTYNVGSISEINKDNEVISIVQKGEINELAKAISWLLKNDDIRLDMAEKAYKRAFDFISDDKEIIKDIVTAYQKVISDFKLKKHLN